MAEDVPTGIVEAIPVIGDIVEVVKKFGELLEVSVVMTVYNRTNETLVLGRFSQDDDGFSQGKFADFPAPDIAPGDHDEFRFDKGFELSDPTDTSNIGFVEYAVGQTGTTWRLEWKNPVVGDPTCKMTIDPESADFNDAQAVGEGTVAPISTVLRQAGFDHGEGGATTSRCIITVENQTESVLTLVDQGHEPNRGGFFTQPKQVLQPGEADSFGSVETQGVADARLQGSAGFLKYRIEQPGGGFWISRWDNPERAQNTSDSRVEEVPEGFEFTALDEIGEGDDNVPVNFTLSGGPSGGVFDAEWAPPVEREQPTLRKGDKRDDGWVEYLQELLNQKVNAGLAVDGDFGGATQRAVDKLQRDFDIQEDHVVGNQTWAVLRGETPVPASTDGLAPHTFHEQGAEARWRGEGEQAMTYDAAADLLTMHIVSVGNVLPDGHVATLRFTGNDAGEVFVAEAPISQPITVHEGGGADYTIEAEGLRDAYGVGAHTVEAYLPAELGGDYVTFQIRVE